MGYCVVVLSCSVGVDPRVCFDPCYLSGISVDDSYARNHLHLAEPLLPVVSGMLLATFTSVWGRAVGECGVQWDKLGMAYCPGS